MWSITSACSGCIARIEADQKTVRGTVFPTRLHVRRRDGRKRAIGTRAPMLVPMAPNQQWSLDPRHGHSDPWRSHGSMSDQLTDGRRFRTMTVVDNCTRECLALIADTSLSGARVARELATIIERRGKPTIIISDRRRSENDPGDRFPEEGHRVHLERDPRLRRQMQGRLTCAIVARTNGATMGRIAPGKPTQNPRPLSRTSGVRCLDHRKLQRAAARRISERNPVPVAGSCPRHAGQLAR